MASSAPRGQWRLDQPHRKPPNPHLFDLPKVPEIRLLSMKLDDVDLDFREYSRELARYPGLNRYVIAYANYLVNSTDHRILNSAHASAILGLRGLRRALQPLLEPDSSRSKAG